MIFIGFAHFANHAKYAPPGEPQTQRAGPEISFHHPLTPSSGRRGVRHSKHGGEV